MKPLFAIAMMIFTVWGVFVWFRPVRIEQRFIRYDSCVMSGPRDYLDTASGELARVTDRTKAQCAKDFDGNQDACLRVRFAENWSKWLSTHSASSEPTGPIGPPR